MLQVFDHERERKVERWKVTNYTRYRSPADYCHQLTATIQATATRHSENVRPSPTTQPTDIGPR